MKANALLTAIKKGDVRKYLPDTRNDPSDWKSGKRRRQVLKEGGAYNVGFAVHDDNITTRSERAPPPKV